MLRKFLFPIILIIAFGSSSKAQDEDLLLVSTIPAELIKNSNAVVRLNSKIYTIKDRRKMSISHNRIVTVLNEEGNYFIDAFLGYDKHVRIRKVEAIIYDEFGEVLKKIKKGDFVDQSAVDGGTLYSDSRVLYMSYMPITYPFTVHFKYELETPNTAFIPSWRPISGYYVSTEKDVFSINDMANLGVRFKTKRFEEYAIETRNKNASSVTFTASNIKALKPEDLSPSLAKVTPQGMVATDIFHYNGVDGEAKNWLEFGDWMYHSLLKGRNEVSDSTKKEVLQLVEGIEDPIEKAKQIYKYVQNNTRYISVQVGIGGIQPIPALEVDRLKYGDCKGLVNYTQSLLDVVGVDSYYSIVQAGPEIVDFESDFATLEQGNHIILGIQNNKDLVWVDCTSQINPFGFIGDFTDNRNVLLVKDGESEIVKTTFYPDSLNTQISKANIKLYEDGSFSSNIEIKTNGIQYDSRFGIESLSNKDAIKYYKRYWKTVNNLEVETYKFNNDKSRVEFTEDLKLNANNYASINGQRFIFSPNVFNRSSFVPSRYRNRNLPLEIQRGYIDFDENKIHLPDGYSIEALPENVFIENEFGTYTLKYSVDENSISYSRKLFIKTGKYDKSKYGLYRDFRKKISKLDNAIIVLIHN